MRVWATALAAAVCLQSAAAGILDVTVGPAGSAMLSVNGVKWLRTDDAGIYTQGSMRLASGGGLVPGDVSRSAGVDAYGSFNRTAQQWTIKATGESFSTAVRDYTPDADVVVFEQVRRSASG